MHLWPLFSMCLVSLAILAQTKHRRGRARVGSRAWQAAVWLDHHVLTPARGLGRRGADVKAPDDRLGGCVLYHCSRVHARTIGDVLVVPPLDVLAIAMRREGHRNLLWFEDLSATDDRLGSALNDPARGVASILAAARNLVRNTNTPAALQRLPEFPRWCAELSGFLPLSDKFLTLWLARQVDLTRSVAQCYGAVFDRHGAPDLLVMLNGGFASTAGLTVAARRRGIPVVEVQHGADSACAPTSAGQVHDFSEFDTAPDGLVSWETEPRQGARVFPVGPIGLHLPGMIMSEHPADSRLHGVLRAQLDRERDALEDYAQSFGAEREVLVSLQPGDTGAWIGALAADLPRTLFWMRRHGSDLGNPQQAAGTPEMEYALASASTLPLLLSRVSAHVTKFSAVTLEAAAVGVPTVATHPYARELYTGIVRDDLLRVERDPREAAAALRAFLARPRTPASMSLPDIGGVAGFLESFIQARGKL